MIDTEPTRSKNIQVPRFDPKVVKAYNNEYIDETSARVSKLFNQEWISRYQSAHKSMFHNRYEFKYT